MSESEDIKTYQRAENAKRVLNNELYQESWEWVRQALIKEWENSPQRDKEGREHLHLMLSCMKMARNHLEAHLQEGKVAAKRLSDLEKRRGLNIRSIF